jgi:hypothetical protein
VTVNGIEATNTSFANPEITGIINSQDSGQLPTRGTRLNASAGWSFRKESFPYLGMNFDHFQPIRKFSVFATGRADTSMGRKLTFYDQFTTGGLTELDAYRYQEIRGNTLLMAGGGFLTGEPILMGLSIPAHIRLMVPGGKRGLANCRFANQAERERGSIHANPSRLLLHGCRFRP